MKALLFLILVLCAVPGLLLSTFLLRQKNNLIDIQALDSRSQPETVQEEMQTTELEERIFYLRVFGLKFEMAPLISKLQTFCAYVVLISLIAYCISIAVIVFYRATFTVYTR
jgi:hypothetical protein